jgi:hypothetical protein
LEVGEGARERQLATWAPMTPATAIAAANGFPARIDMVVDC